MEKNLKAVMLLALLMGTALIGCIESDVKNDTSMSFVNDEKNDTSMSFVIIFTDDQRWDTLWAMPIVQEKLVNPGVIFTNAYVTIPSCCPSRASLLSGGFYPHNTGVLSNKAPNGGVQKFYDQVTLATLLQKEGYATAMVGKYLNRYQDIAPYIPPGWTTFISRPGPPYYPDSWTNYSIVYGSSNTKSSQGELYSPMDQYLTDYYGDKSLEFLDQYGESPFFLLVSLDAPHSPATPSPRDAQLFSDYLYRGRAYGEENLSDKPAVVQKQAWNFRGKVNSLAEEDEFHRNQLRSLQSVDRLTGAIVDKLEETGRLDSTVIIFTSDHGFMWGEHALFAKGKPYEESIRVPFVILFPGIESRVDENLVAMNLDIGTTIFDLAGIKKDTDGLSLVSLLKEPDTEWREEFLIQAFSQNWAGLRIKRDGVEWKYIERSSGERELYNLINDPFEEESSHNDLEHQELIRTFSLRLEELKGVTLKDSKTPLGEVGKKYTFQLEPWGGIEPYTWQIVNGTLPEGLSLNRYSGLISGIPVKPEKQEFLIMVESSSLGRQTEKPQNFIKEYKITIKKS
jgi:arylsulfatase A-like enzyme